MKHLFSAWDSIGKELEAKYVYLFLDCDGTLAPIADTPDEAAIPEKTKEALASLSRLERLKVAVISGRSLADIKTMVGLDHIVYAGNHGLEIENEDITSEWETKSGYRKTLEDIKLRLKSECAMMPGVFVEDKGLALCLHYRMSGIDEEKIRDIFSKITHPHEALGAVETMHGKKVLEVRPALEWHKGKIVKWLLARERFLVQHENILAVYVGDDRTDEDAFKALGENDISVMVGNAAASSARYYVDDTGEVYQLLIMILKARSH